MKRSVFTTIFIICIVFQGFAQQYNADSVISILVSDIKKEQIKNQGEFIPGMFYSFRGASAFPHNYQPDNNIFFTAIGNFTLNNIKSTLEPTHQRSIDTILNKSRQAFSFFQQKDGLPFYNFWPRGGKIMPHSLIAQHLSKKLNISEDADDTVMILMSLENNDSINQMVKKRLVEVSNKGSAGKQIHSSYKRFKDYEAYTTYLGYKMQTDFDFAVQCNVLFFSYKTELPFSKQDSSTLQLIAEMTRERLYMKNASFIAPYYGKPSLILYHLTRLMSAFHPRALEAYKKSIVEDLYILLRKAKTPLEKIILQTSLIRMGENPEMPTAREIQEIRLIDQHKFSFFQARPAYWYRPWLKDIFLHAEFINYKFFSPTYDKILLLENLVLRKNINQPFVYH